MLPIGGEGGFPGIVSEFLQLLPLFLLSFRACYALCMMPGNRTKHDDVVRVVELHKVGKNNREIAHLVGLTESTVSRLLNKWRVGGKGDFVPTHKHAGGKALAISPKALRLVKRQLDLQPSITAKELKEKNPKLLGGVSIRTIQENIQKRLNYSKVKALGHCPTKGSTRQICQRIQRLGHYRLEKGTLDR